MVQRFSSVWYATPEKIESMIKLIVFNDRGSLDISPAEVQYQGKKHVMSMRTIAKVSLARQRIPWVSYIIGNIAAVAYLAILYSGRLNVGILAALLVAGNLFGLLIAMSTKWILVEYQDESGQARRAYFADGSMLGWGGILGGTTRLFHAIEEQRQGGK